MRHGFPGWQKADMARLETGLAELRADISEVHDRVVRVEAGQVMTGERMARIEGTVAGALGRPFPGADRVARAPEASENAAN